MTVRGLWLALGCAVALGACADVKALIVLQRDVRQHFGYDTHLTLTNRDALTVTFVDVPDDSLPQDRRAPFADSVAAFVATHYAGFDSLATVSVAFESERGAAGVHLTSTVTPFRFTTAEIKGWRQRADSAAAR